MSKLLQIVSAGLLLLLPLLGRAQQNHITGRVVDAKTKEPIAFASVGLRNSGTGALTNEQGDFQLDGLKSIKQDSIIVMTLGYERYAAFVESNTSNSLTIEITRRNVEALGKRVTFVCNLSSSKPEPNHLAGIPGTQYAFFIGNEKQKKLGKLRTVSFYIGENGLPMESFRIRIYKADGTSRSPSTDLLNERVFITATTADEWCTSDLSRYNIAAPQEGYFIALEFAKPANALSQPVIMEHYTPQGLIMRPAFEYKKSITWIYSPEQGWNLLSQTNGSRRYNAMVKAEVETVE